MKPNNALIEQYELLKEIHFVFENIEPTIKGRIFKVVKGPNSAYMWTVNYYCRLNSEAGIYTPSAPLADELEIAEIQLNKYVKRFEMAVDWIGDEYF